MISVNLKSIEISELKKKDKRWLAYIKLNLLDRESGNALSEWFYSVKANSEYMQNPVDKADLVHQSIIEVSNELDLDDIAGQIRSDVESIQAPSWADMFKQLEERYLHDD